ncbi:MAG: hypothetical protein U1E89_18305 [Burkholderiaceae bacterium]
MIDDELVNLAGRIVDAIDRRRDITETYSLGAEWSGPGANLWDMLEAVAHLPAFQGTCLDSTAKLSVLLSYMRGTSRATPGLGDLMQQLRDSTPGKPYARRAIEAEALAATRGAKPGELAERVRLFLADLASEQWEDRHGRYASVLDCFTPTMLATLLRVVGGFDPHDEDNPPALTIAAIERGLSRFRSGAGGTQARNKRTT